MLGIVSMDVSFIIGNGFDINLNLDTRYKDFYPFFKNEASEGNIIKKWLDEDNNIELWSDYERRLGEKTENLNESQIDAFFDSKEEADSLLAKYIDNQQAKLSDEFITAIRGSFYDGLLRFNKFFNEEDLIKANKIYNISMQENNRFNILNFNYSAIIDRLCSESKSKPMHARIINNNRFEDRIGDILHIHGTTEGEMIVGVNDVSQICNSNLRANDYFVSSFTKDLMNKTIGQNRTNKFKSIINRSRIIVVYGFSRGITDKNRWDELLKWCLSDQPRILVLCEYISGIERQRLIQRVPSAINRKRINVIGELMKLGNVSAENRDRLDDRLILCFDNIFDFSNLL